MPSVPSRLDRLGDLQHVRQVAGDQIPVHGVLGEQTIDVAVHFARGRSKPFQVFPVTDARHQLDAQQKRQPVDRRALRLGIAMDGVGLDIGLVPGEAIQNIDRLPDAAGDEMREPRVE